MFSTAEDCGLRDAWVETKSCLLSVSRNRRNCSSKAEPWKNQCAELESSKALSAEFLGIALSWLPLTPTQVWPEDPEATLRAACRVMRMMGPQLPTGKNLRRCSRVIFGQAAWSSRLSARIGIKPGAWWPTRAKLIPNPRNLDTTAPYGQSPYPMSLEFQVAKWAQESLGLQLDASP